MAEPFSIFASALAVAAAAIQSSRILIEIASGMKTTPKEVIAISQDAQSIHDTISSLHTTLTNAKAKIKTVNNTDNDDVMMFDEIMENLTNPLSNCEKILKELVFAMQKQLKFITKDVGGDRTGGVTSLKWVLYKKDKIKELQHRLEAAKLTLNTALSGVLM